MPRSRRDQPAATRAGNGASADHCRRNLGEVEQAARAAGVDCETYFEEENRSVPDAIAHITQQKKCDLVVMGTNGRHGLAAMLKPSNAKAVAKYLAVPILVVH